MSAQLDPTSLNRVRPATPDLSESEARLGDGIQNGLSSLPFHVQSFLIESCAPRGIVIVDGTGAIQFATGLAEKFMSTDSSLTIRHGRVHIDRASIDRELKELIADAVSDAGEAERTSDRGIVGVPGKDGRTRYAIKVLSPGMQNGASNKLAVLLVADLIQAPRMERSSLVRLFRLSDREAELAQLFYDGYHVADIARRMNVTENTVRVHLRGVFAKTGFNRQIDLARALAHVP